jgi:hypothetical protein
MDVVEFSLFIHTAPALEAGIYFLMSSDLSTMPVSEWSVGILKEASMEI